MVQKIYRKMHPVSIFVDTFWLYWGLKMFLKLFAKIFLKFIDKNFPRTHWLHKVFNRNTIKVSYSCMSNVQQLIKKYNNFIQNKKNKTALSCNCRNKNECLNGRLNGNCRLENIIYKCTSLTKNNVKKVYLGVRIQQPSTIVPKRRL